MSTFGTLKSDIAAWLARSDLTSVIPSFVTLAESDIRDDIRVRAMETNSTLTLNAQSVALPTNFLQARGLVLDISTEARQLDQVTPERIWEFPVLAGTPTTYAIEGANAVFYPDPSGITPNVEARLSYVAMFDALSGDSDTNWLLANAYDVYLFASLKHACIYTMDEEQAAKYDALYSAKVTKLNQVENTARYSGAALVSTGTYTP